MTKIKPRATWKTLVRLVPFLKPHAFWMGVSVVCTSADAILNILAALFMQNLTDSALNAQSAAFVELVWRGLVLVAAAKIAGYLRRHSTARYTTYTIRDLRNRVTQRIQRLPVAYLEAHHTGDLVSRLNADTREIANLLRNIPERARQPLLFACAFTVMLLTSWKLLLATCILIPISALLFNILVKPIQVYAKQLMEDLARANAALEDAIGGIHVAKAYNLKSVLCCKYEALVEEIEAKGLQIDKRLSALYSVWIALKYVPQLVCPLYGGYLVFQGEITIGSLMACNLLIWFVFVPVESLLGLLVQVRQAVPAVQRLNDVLDQPVERVDGHGFAAVRGEAPVTFENVSFGYDDEEYVLQDLSFQLRAGRTTALVGPSGSGKSTVLKLLCGFYEPQQGAVRLYGNDLSQVDLSAARARLSLVSQDPYLFNTTVAENIAWGRLGATQEKVTAAALAANAHAFIVALPEGYETRVGERGGQLSGGERQRIALARAVLKDAPILLLDEPTSALDARSEASMAKALERFTDGRTVLIVAHRLSTIAQADQILVLDEGRIVERGTHRELMGAGGLYRRLYLDQTSLPEHSQQPSMQREVSYAPAG